MIQTLEIQLPESLVEQAQRLRERGGYGSVAEVIAVSLAQMESGIDASEDLDGTNEVEDIDGLRDEVLKGAEQAALGKLIDGRALRAEFMSRRSPAAEMKK